MIYDLRGNVIETRYPGDSSHPEGSLTRNVYDEDGRVAVTVDLHVPGQSANGTRTTYDAAGKAKKTERLSNVVIDIVNGNSSSLVSVGPVISMASTNFDKDGRRVLVTDALLRETTFDYDAVNRLIKTVFADSSFTSVIYDI